MKPSSTKTRRASLEQILFSQGFGTRKLCRVLVMQGKVEVAGEVCEDSDAEFELGSPDAPFEFTVRGERWQYHEQAYLMLNKPPGYECSQKPKSHLSVYELLPPPLRERGKGGVQAVGRLDQDTTGLLIFCDDGQMIHRMTSPKHEVPKVYEITTSENVTQQQINKLLAGVVLADDPEPVQASACEFKSDKHLSMTLTSGKYHQVKRMLAAVGNNVAGLHRSRIGHLSLPADLAQGQWRWLTPSELAAANQRDAKVPA
jgi:16S rRNA pseudouridine516 synthase